MWVMFAALRSMISRARSAATVEFSPPLANKVFPGHQAGAAAAVRFRPGILGGVCSGRSVEVRASALVSGVKNTQAPVQPSSREPRLACVSVPVIGDGIGDELDWLAGN